MRALSRSCGYRIPASRQAGGSAAGHRSEVPRPYSPTGCARCARSSRSRPAARDSGVRDETVDASRPINANGRFAMGGTDVTEETRHGIATNCAWAVSIMRLPMPILRLVFSYHRSEGYMCLSFECSHYVLLRRLM